MDLFPRSIFVLPVFPRFRGVRKAARRAGLLLAVIAPSSVLQAQSNYAILYAFTTLAGMSGSQGSTDGKGSAARFNTPFGVAVDGAGNAYVAATSNHTIRKGVPRVDSTTASVPGLKTPVI